MSGGVECWDKRRAGRPQQRSPLGWGLTGCKALDAAQVGAVSKGSWSIFLTHLNPSSSLRAGCSC